MDLYNHNPQYHVSRISEATLWTEGGTPVEFPLKPYYDATQSGAIYQAIPDSHKHVHDLPMVEPDKEDTNAEFNGTESSGAIEGGIAPFQGGDNAPCVADILPIVDLRQRQWRQRSCVGRSSGS